MGRKKKHPGSDYAWKHGLVKTKTENRDRIGSLLTPEETDLLYKPHEFAKMFDRKDLSEQISLFTRLYTLIDVNGKVKLCQDDEDIGYLAANRLKQILDNMRAKLVSGECGVISADECRILRAECSGTFNRPSVKDKLSELYKFFTRQENLGVYPSRAYDMRTSPMWRVFRQFESYRNIERNLKQYMQKKGIHPLALKVMTVTDFFDALYNTFKRDNESEVASFMPGNRGIKQQILKDVMHQCRGQIEEKLIQQGYDIRCVKSICHAAERFGVWSPASVVPTEMNYTQRILDDMEQNGFDISAFKVGDPIPTKMVDYMIDHKQLELLRARTPNGDPVYAKMLPNLHFHHNLSHVVLARSLPTIAAANYPNSGVFVLDKIHNKVLHNSHDKLTNIFYNRQFFSHIQLTDPHLKIMFGLNAEKEGIFCDLEKTPQFLKRRKQDLKNAVSYDEMEMLRQKYVTQIYGSPQKKGKKQKKEATIIARKQNQGR
ncbi:MAG: hypothetical protein IJ852_00715 [Alphaproteobacteria bacterium]|nr:hypothetical protein [Alphaproteobacteria bacterium]